MQTSDRMSEERLSPYMRKREDNLRVYVNDGLNPDSRTGGFPYALLQVNFITDIYTHLARQVSATMCFSS
jgi:hypothetical protein